MHIFHPDNGHFLCPYNPHLGPTIQWLHYRVNWVDIYERVSKRHSFFSYTVCCKSFQKKLQWENSDWDQASSSVLPSQSFVFTMSPTSFTRTYTLMCQRSLFMRRSWMKLSFPSRFSFVLISLWITPWSFEDFPTKMYKNFSLESECTTPDWRAGRAIKGRI